MCVRQSNGGADRKGKRYCTHTAPCSCESWNMTSGLFCGTFGMNCAPGHCDLRSTKVKLQAAVAVVLFPTYVWTYKALFNIRWRTLTGIKPKIMLYEKWQQQILNLQSELLPIPRFLCSLSAVQQTYPCRLPPHHLCCVLLFHWTTGVTAHTHTYYVKQNQDSRLQSFHVTASLILTVTWSAAF